MRYLCCLGAILASGFLAPASAAGTSGSPSPVSFVKRAHRSAAAKIVPRRAFVPRWTGAAADAGTIVFDGSFETPSLLSQWNAQCSNTGLGSDSMFTRGTVNVDASVVGEGGRGARFDLPASSQRSACEVLRLRTLNLGTDDYYGLMFRFPDNWREPASVPWGVSLAQFNYERIWGSPVQLVGHGDRVTLIVQSGFCSDGSSAPPGCAYTSGPGGNLANMEAIPPPLARDTWHELVVHVRWTVEAAGIVEVWHRLRGTRAWTKTVALSGVPTVQWKASEPVLVPERPTVDKIGAYRGAADFPLSVWHDGFVVGTTFGAVAARLP